MRHGSHTISRLSVHLVWVTKYRYHVLKGDVKTRCLEIVRQCCEVEEVKILDGAVSVDHVHLMIEYPPKLSVSQFMKNIKGRTSKMLQQEFPSLSNRYWGRHFWATGYGAWSVGDKTEQLVKDYLAHHEGPRDNDTNVILEN